jgi:hypothetical protein
MMLRIRLLMCARAGTEVPGAMFLWQFSQQIHEKQEASRARRFPVRRASVSGTKGADGAVTGTSVTVRPGAR